MGQQNSQKIIKVSKIDKNSLSNTTWEYKYHLVFAPKYRRQIIYGQNKADVAEKLSMLSERKGTEIIEAECCKDHIHMLVRIPPKHSVSEIMGYLKGKSSLMIFEKHANLKYKYGNRHFWCRGYYVDTVGKNAKKIQEYIQNQLKSDMEYDQLTLNEYIGPFTGEPVKEAKSKSQGHAQEAEGTGIGHLEPACEKQYERRTLSVRLSGVSREESLIGAEQTTG